MKMAMQKYLELILETVNTSNYKVSKPEEKGDEETKENITEENETEEKVTEKKETEKIKVEKSNNISLINKSKKGVILPRTGF